MAGKSFSGRTNDVLDRAWLREHFKYDRRGFFVRKKHMGGPTLAGDIVDGCFGTSGYKTIRLCGKSVLLHRAVYAYHHDRMPRFIDHINRDRLDNRIENLRSGDGGVNHHNRTQYKGTVSGVTGVTYLKKKKLWRARIAHQGRTFSLGRSKNKDLLVKRVHKFRQELLAGLTSQV